MLSKQMYLVLSLFPHDGDGILYEEIVEKCVLDKFQIDRNLNETLFPEWNYVRTSDGFKIGSYLYLTESGKAKVEEYEQEEKNQTIMDKSLMISRIALWVAIASAIISMFK